MYFNSLTFFAFLLAVLLFRLVLPWKYGRWLMVAASYVFYGTANPWYCFLLFTSTIVDFIVAQLIYRSESGSRRKALLAVSLLVTWA